MSKKKQEEAKAKAQKQVQQRSGGNGGGGGGGKKAQAAAPSIKQAMSSVGDRLGKGEVKDLRRAGYSKQQMQRVAARVDTVSGGAQRILDRGGANGGGDSSLGRKVTAISSGDKSKLDSKGRLIAGSAYTPVVGLGGGLTDNGRFSATEQSSKKINNYLDKTGYSLRGGNGRKVVGFKTINTTGYNNPFANPNGGINIPGSKETLAIYGPSKKERRAERNGDGERSRGGGRERSRGGASGGGAPRGGTSSAVGRTRQYAEDRLYGRVPEGIKPEMFPEGTPVEGRAPEAVANYTDRLDAYNQGTMGWMNDRAVASQYESGQFLRNFAAGLPKAPDVMSTDEMFRTARRFTNIDYT